MAVQPHFVTLGMFIVDEFSYLNEDGRPDDRVSEPQAGGISVHWSRHHAYILRSVVEEPTLRQGRGYGMYLIRWPEKRTECWSGCRRTDWA